MLPRFRRRCLESLRSPAVGFARRSREDDWDEDEDDLDRLRQMSQSEQAGSKQGIHPAVLVLGLIGTTLVLIVGICCGTIWWVTRSVTRTMDNMMTTIQNAQPPMPPARPVLDRADALERLRSPDPSERLAAVQWFVVHQPDPDPIRRQEVTTALSPLLRDEDLGVRMTAEHALRRWR
jgi:hypothetical protein